MQKKIAVEARLPLLLECRTSGLSDRAWCLKNGINPDTFRWWVTELKKKKYDIPPAGNKTKNMAVDNRTKIEVTCKLETFKQPSDVLNESIKSDMCPAFEIDLGFALIKVSNGIKPEILEKILQFLKVYANDIALLS